MFSICQEFPRHSLLYLEDISFYKVALEQVVSSDLSVHQQSLEDSILKPALAYVERGNRAAKAYKHWEQTRMKELERLICHLSIKGSEVRNPVNRPTFCI